MPTLNKEIIMPAMPPSSHSGRPRMLPALIMLSVSLGVSASHGAETPAAQAEGIQAPVPDSSETMLARRTRTVYCDSADIVYGKDWKPVKDGRARVSDVPGSTIELTFKGREIYWRAWMDAQSGRADVYLDGHRESTVDCYTNHPTERHFGFVKTGLDPAKPHTIRIVTRGDRNPLSKGAGITHLSFEHSAECYRASEGYSTIQGLNQWRYQETIGTSAGDMSSLGGRWTGANGATIICRHRKPQDGDTWQQTEMLLGPSHSTSSRTFGAALKWVAPRAGKVRIEGTALLDAADKAELIATVSKDAKELRSACLTSQGSKAFSHDVTVPMNAGESLSFHVQHGPRAIPASGLEVIHEDSGNRQPDQVTAGKPLTIGTQRFAHGLRTDSSCEIRVHLSSPGKSFRAQIGMDPRYHGKPTGGVVLAVEIAGRSVFRSALICARRTVEPVAVDVGLADAMDFLLSVTLVGPTGSFKPGAANVAAAEVVLADGTTLRLSDLPILPRPGICWNPQVTYVE